MALNNLKVALVYDRVNTPFGGAEQVLLALHELFPQAPLFTSVYDKNKASWAKDLDVRPSFLQSIPFAKTHHREFVSLMPKVFESLDLSNFDIVISISSAEAKGIKTKANQLHICYVLTPTRYLWSHHLEYEQGILKPLKAFIFSKLRLWDFKAAQHPQNLIAISKLIAQRTEKYYRRKVDSVIYPPYTPFDNQPITFEAEKNFLIVSRLVEYKNIDLAIKVCAKNNWPLQIVGTGPDKARLQQLVDDLQAKEFVTFWEDVSRSQLGILYSKAKAFLLPNEEDFGISALEALSQGCPVITSRHSGVAELISDQKTGILLDQISGEYLQSAMQKSQQLSWKKTAIAQSVVEYNKVNFQKNFLDSVEKLWKKHLDLSS